KTAYEIFTYWSSDVCSSDLEDLSLAYSNLAKAYYSIKDYDKSIEFYLKALQAQEQLNDKKAIDVSNSRLAELFSKKKEYRKAIDYYEKVLANNASNDSVRATIYPRLGGEYLQFNDFDNASRYLTEGLSLNRRQNNNEGLLIALTNLGNLNLQQFKLGIAETQLLEAGEVAQNTNNKTERLKHYKLLKSLDSIRHRFEAADTWQRKYYDLKTAINNENNIVTNTRGTEEPALDLSLNFDQPDTNTISPNTNETKTKKDFERLQLIFYALLAALVIVLTFLVL